MKFSVSSNILLLTIDLSAISQGNGAFKFWKIGQKRSIAADATRFSE
jgi:hypothetical protein